MIKNVTEKGTRLDKLSRRYAKMTNKQLVTSWFMRRKLQREEFEVLSKAMEARRVRCGGFIDL